MLTEQELLERARELRRNPTEWEVRLWRHLSNTQLASKFRRQHVIYPHICDFFCPSKGLIVELDGDTHDAEPDRKRDTRMARQGYATLRFTNTDVRENIEGVVATIAAALLERPDRWSGMPHPNPASGKQRPALFRPCRGHGRPDAPEGEGLRR